MSQIDKGLSAEDVQLIQRVASKYPSDVSDAIEHLWIDLPQPRKAR